MFHIWLVSGLEFHFSTGSVKICIDDDHFTNYDELFRIFGGKI